MELKKAWHHIKQRDAHENLTKKGQEAPPQNFLPFFSIDF
jgi:hypothetical protein